MVLEDLPTRLLAFGVAPALPISLCLIGIGRWRPSLFLNAFAMGAVACLIAIIEAVVRDEFLHVTPDWLQTVLIAWLVAAIPEELTKYAAVNVVVAQHEDTDIGLDLILGSAWLALGFGIFENVFYVIQSPQWAKVALVRAVLAVPAHVAFGIIMGACLAMAAYARGAAAWWKITACAAPIVLHGAYDSGYLLGAANRSSVTLLPLAYLGTSAVVVITAWAIAGPVIRVIYRAGMVDLLALSPRINNIATNQLLMRWVRGVAFILFFASALCMALVAIVDAPGSATLAFLVTVTVAQTLGFMLFAYRGARAFRRSIGYSWALANFEKGFEVR
jgi:hypothetical protein